MRWVAWLVTVVLVGVTGYLTWASFTDPVGVACPFDGEGVDCGTVLSSQWASVAGVPVAVIGLVWAVACLVVFHPRVWFRGPFRGRLFRWGLVGAGVVSVFWLVWVEFAYVKAVCVWCTVVHVGVLVLAVLLIVEWATEPTPTSLDA